MGKTGNKDDSNNQQGKCDDIAPQAIKANRSGLSSWQIPQGVSPGTWDYVRGRGIAEDYDAFLDNDPLIAVDRKILDRYLPPIESRDFENGKTIPQVADLGCGAGRHTIQLAESGYGVLAVDLSLPMLTCLKQKVFHQPNWRSNIATIQANLVELDGLRTDSLDHAICMFSTLGMIQGRTNRIQFLEHVRRIVKDDGQLVLHVHNLWYQLKHPGGVSWMTKNVWSAITGKSELGDRLANYRGVKNMFIHSFRRSELANDLATSGFQQLKWFGILPDSTEVQEDPKRINAMKYVGWIIVCR